jgi:nucleoside-diphosphate-sugar epimerase
MPFTHTVAGDGISVKDIFAPSHLLQFNSVMRVLIVGCGYVGLALGVKLKAEGHEVFGLRRSPESETALRTAGIHPLCGDITQPHSLSALQHPFDWVVHCASAGGGGLEAYRRVYLEGTRNLLARLAATPGSSSAGHTQRTSTAPRLIYTSSTGVYGQDDGSWVTERSATEPATDTSKVLVEAEEVLLDACRDAGFPAIILRLAGIYGPGRGYWFNQFLNQQARMDGDGSRFLNMIHREDVAGAIMAALERGRPGEVYNVVDDEPVAQRDLFRWLADTLHQPMPPSASRDASLRKRGATNKRVSNRKLRECLGYRMRFPTFRDGFEALLGSQS